MKLTQKSVYDLAKKELKSRAEVKLDDNTKLGINHSDKSALVSVDLERGPFKAGFDFLREDLVFQYKRRSKAATFTFKQVVPNLKWELVPTPVVEISTKLLDSNRWKDSLRLMYDFQNRSAYYTETLKLRVAGDTPYKLRVAGDSKTSDHAFCLGVKPNSRWAKSLKLVHTQASGPILSHKLKPAPAWKLHTEAAIKPRVVSSSVTYKALQGDAEFVLDAAIPLTGSGDWRLFRKAGVKVDYRF